MDLSDYVRNLAFDGTETKALDQLSKLAELPDMRGKISSALMGNERPELENKSVVAHIAEKFLVIDEDERHPLLMPALLLLVKLSQGSAQSAKCLAVGEVLDAVIGLVVNDDGRDGDELTTQVLSFFQQIAVYKELRPTLMKTNWLLQELVAISASSERRRAQKATALSILGSIALEESSRKKLLKLPLKLKEMLVGLLDVELKRDHAAAETGESEVLEKLLWLLRSFCKDTKICAEMAADEQLVTSLLSERVLFCYNGRVDDHVLNTLEHMISLRNEAISDTITQAGIVERFVKILQESGTAVRKWKQSTKRLCKLVYMLSIASGRVPVALTRTEGGKGEPLYFNSTLRRLQSNSEALPLLLPLIGSLGEIGTQVAVMTALAFGDRDGVDNALLAKPVGPKSLLDVLLERLESSMKGDNGETRPYGTLLAVALGLDALSLSDVNAAWMHTRKETMQEMREALEDMHATAGGFPLGLEQQHGDDDFAEALRALDFAIGRCKPPTLVDEALVSLSPGATCTSDTGISLPASATASAPKEIEVITVGALVEAVVAELVLKVEHSYELERQRNEHDAEIASQKETLEKQLVTHTELLANEKKEQQDSLAKAIVSTMASSLVHAEVTAATTKAIISIDHKLHPHKKHQGHEHVPVDLGRALKESHALDEGQHQKAALAAAERDLQHLRMEMHKQKEEAAALRVEARKGHEKAEVMKLEVETHMRTAAEHQDARSRLVAENERLQRELEAKAVINGVITEQASPGTTEQGSPLPPVGGRPSQLSPRSAASTNTLHTSLASPASIAISEATAGGGEHPLMMVGGNSHLEDSFAASAVLEDTDTLAYISNPAKVVNVRELNTLLDSWGISHSYELSHIDRAEVEEIARMLKPIPRKVFLEKMKAL
jgi:hypothetical protein